MAADPPVQLTPGLVAGMAALAVVVHEAHELSHTAVGRLVCGGWGPRNFNTWDLPADCTSVIPTVAGPVFSFALMWIGAAMLGAPSRRWLPLGLALVITANPFARLLTAVLGGGDEGALVRHWTGLPRGMPAILLTALPVALLVSVPLWRAWNRLAPRRRPLHFTGLLVLPMLVTGLLLFVAGNRLLRLGVLAGPELAGTPLLVWLVTLVAAGAAVALRRHFSDEAVLGT